MMTHGHVSTPAAPQQEHTNSELPRSPTSAVLHLNQWGLHDIRPGIKTRSPECPNPNTSVVGGITSCMHARSMMKASYVCINIFNLSTRLAAYERKCTSLWQLRERQTAPKPFMNLQMPEEALQKSAWNLPASMQKMNKNVTKIMNENKTHKNKFPYLLINGRNRWKMHLKWDRRKGKPTLRVSP